MALISFDGLDLYYESQGNGMPVVFIQGVGIVGRAWSPQTNSLQAEFRCITFDNRGVGQSRGPTTGLSIDRMVADTVGLLDKLGIERAHIVGHSMGGIIAQQLGLDHRERVLSLVLMCTLFRGKDAMIPTWSMIRHGIATNVGTLSMRRRAFARMVLSGEYIGRAGIDPSVGMLEKVFERPLAPLPAITGFQLRALSRHDSSHRVRELNGIPTLVITGREDPIGRIGLGRKLAGSIEGAGYHEIESASHALPIEKPQLVNGLLRSFLHQVDGR